MGQRLKSQGNRFQTSRPSPDTPSDGRVAVFPTDLGWFALAGRGEAVGALTIGHATAADALDSIHRRVAAKGDSVEREPADWHPILRRRLEDFARGTTVDFGDVELVSPPMTEFQAAIVTATRRIRYGETRTYSALAEDAGHPRAARAVGNVMAANRFPILVPCHRVVAAGEKLGGFSAPQGVDLKRRMLELEAST